MTVQTFDLGGFVMHGVIMIMVIVSITGFMTVHVALSICVVVAAVRAVNVLTRAT
jgi:heme/copper-type cytochrome/quinol oxidase subunit 1